MSAPCQHRHRKRNTSLFTKRRTRDNLQNLRGCGYRALTVSDALSVAGHPQEPCDLVVLDPRFPASTPGAMPTSPGSASHEDLAGNRALR